MNKLFIISNESIYKNDDNGYLCDNLDMKSTPEGLAGSFEVNIIARKSKHVRCHTINTDKISLSSSIFSFLKDIMKSLKNKESKYLIISISPYTFLACIFLKLFKKKTYSLFKKRWLWRIQNNSWFSRTSHLSFYVYYYFNNFSLN